MDPHSPWLGRVSSEQAPVTGRVGFQGAVHRLLPGLEELVVVIGEAVLEAHVHEGLTGRPQVRLAEVGIHEPDAARPDVAVLLEAAEVVPRAGRPMGEHEEKHEQLQDAEVVGTRGLVQDLANPCNPQEPRGLEEIQGRDRLHVGKEDDSLEWDGGHQV